VHPAACRPTVPLLRAGLAGTRRRHARRRGGSLLKGIVERYTGAPAVFEELKHKPGRRLTLRARGPRGSVIVKLYRSNRVDIVAGRISALADGPGDPEVPAVLAVDPAERLLVLSDVPGIPLREAVLASDESRCHKAGAAIAAWHQAWAGRKPAALREHTIELELDVLADHAGFAAREIGLGVAAELPALREEWTPVTVVHRDLYEEQVLLGERVGLIDLDDAALGPPELDVGNLLAHLDLLELRTGHTLERGKDAFLDGYANGGPLDLHLLERCRTLARLRLACIHGEARLLAPARVLAIASAMSCA
jgi:Ser/Thr protein kinase RdoA (MazF antagonist)